MLRQKWAGLKDLPTTEVGKGATCRARSATDKQMASSSSELWTTVTRWHGHFTSFSIDVLSLGCHLRGLCC